MYYVNSDICIFHLGYYTTNSCNYDVEQIQVTWIDVLTSAVKDLFGFTTD